MSKKKVQIPFSIDEWKKGNVMVETRDGRKVRIVCTDAKLDYCDTPQPILGLVSEDDEEHTETWDEDGYYTGKGFTNKDDLVIVEEQEVPDRWAYDKNAKNEGWYIDTDSKLHYCPDITLNICSNYNIFATEKQAKSALAMARISQLMANDKRYGGVVTEEEWKGSEYKYCIYRNDHGISHERLHHTFNFLAFHTKEQRELFLSENERLVRDYLMIN